MHDEFYSLTGKLKNISEFIWFFFCQGEGALEKWQRHQKRHSACVGQADFGKLGVNNIRKDSGNS